MSSDTELRASENPRNWRFTWESQSHLPILKLYLFNPHAKPSTQCIDLKVNLSLEQSLLKVSWFESQLQVSLKVPMPKVLADFESPVHFKALDDHIEVKVALLLPIDHPLVSTMDSVLNLSLEGDESCSRTLLVDELKPLVMDYDLETLSSRGDVHFYCRNCSYKLTSPLRCFEEMPSVNWREVADNWFGACCCSFGGISEKLVTSYAKSYTSTTGVCLLNTTSVVLCKDDYLGRIPEREGSQIEEHELDSCGHNLNKSNRSEHDSSMSFDTQTKRMRDIDEKLDRISLLEDNRAFSFEHEVINADSLSHLSLTLKEKETVASSPECCLDTNINVQDHNIICCALDASKNSAGEQESDVFELLENQKSFLNGFLGNVFMIRSSNLSKDVHWVELLCPQCSCLLGVCPCGNSGAPFDGGIHLFKCYISTCSGFVLSSNVFRKYTLERMFSNQLLESANDELSFRTVVRDLQTKHPLLQIVLLNPNSWCFVGYCSDDDKQVHRVDMYPAIKLLFSNCSKVGECRLRMIEEWTTKNQADEVYMLASQVKELIGSLELVKDILPPSHILLPGFSLSSLKR